MPTARCTCEPSLIRCNAVDVLGGTAENSTYDLVANIYHDGASDQSESDVGSFKAHILHKVCARTVSCPLRITIC
jgi:uncharacterized protein (DUF2237 family)